MTATHRAQRPDAVPVHFDSSFAHILHAPGPEPGRESTLALYAWLVGHWKFDVTTFTEGGTTHAGNGEIHAGWILRGRAIQDVWMIPRLADRTPCIAQIPGAGNWFGTTLRLYDPGIDAWRILWSDPATSFYCQQIGRARGRDIVQEGPDPLGGRMRWTFTEIEPESFHWTAEKSTNSNQWRKAVDIHARRAD
jgi:hypothetical protein